MFEKQLLSFPLCRAIIAVYSGNGMVSTTRLSELQQCVIKWQVVDERAFISQSSVALLGS